MNPYQRNAATFCIYLLTSAAFTWPLVTDPLGLMPTRQFDLYSLLWLVDTAPELSLSFHSDNAAWPVGQDLSHTDSFLLVVIARLLAFAFSAKAVVAAVTLLGPVFSAWAAERFAARCLAARWPWSLIAGFTFGFSGLTATAMLEGHGYAMLDPWLPLLAWSWLRATGEGGDTQHGLTAGFMWAACLLTTAYLGIVATFLVLAMGLRALFRGTIRPKPMAAAALVALPMGCFYIALFLRSGALMRLEHGGDATVSLAVMHAGSARLGTLAGWVPYVDLGLHSIAPTLGFTALTLALFASVAMGKRQKKARSVWRLFVWLGISSCIISLGPYLDLFAFDLHLPWVLYPLHHFPAVTSFFHFPVRFLHLTTLCLGALGALVATRLAETQPKACAPLLLAALADALVGTGAPIRSHAVPLDVPSVYSQAPQDRAILELFPEFHGMMSDLEFYTSNLTCFYQTEHHRPLFNRCLGTTIHTDPRWMTNRWLTASLLSDDAKGQIIGNLQALGVGAVLLHPDLFSPQDRIEIQLALTKLVGTPVSSDDGGEHLVLYTIPQSEQNANDSIDLLQSRATRSYADLVEAWH